MFEIAGLIIATMSAIASVIQAYNSKRSVSSSEIKKSKKRASKPLKVGGKRVAIVIDDELLTAFYKKIKKEHRELITILESPSATNKDVEKAVFASKQAICFYLIQIKKYNKGKLPTKRLENYWDSYGCKVT